MRFPILRTELLNPPPALRTLRLSDAVHRVTLWNGRSAWLVTRHDDARRALCDSRMSADATDPGFPSINPSQPSPNYRGGPARTGEPRHSQLRQMVVDKFTIRATEEWRGAIEDIANCQVDEFTRGGPPADLLRGFALPTAVRTVGDVIGVPLEDHPFLIESGWLVVARDAERSVPATENLRTYIQQLVRGKEENPGDDVLSQVVQEHLRNGRLSRLEVEDLTFVLLVAGHTTTSATITLGALSLLEAPSRYETLCRTPALIPRAVEEFLRFHTVVADGLPRVAKADLIIGGVTIRAGEAVIISLVSANRDEDVFDRPDELDLCRDARRHLGFGLGPHRCLGQHLARLELNVAFETLTRRLPTLRLAVPFADIRFRQDRFQYGVDELPVTW